MDRRILVPFDGSSPSINALEFALNIHDDAEILVLHIIEKEYLENSYVKLLLGGEKLSERIQKGGEEILEKAEELSEEYDRDIETRIETGNPVKTILDFSKENNIDQIIIGSKGHTSTKTKFLGSVTNKLIHKTNLPITIIK